jgi:hypothetical protein
MEENLSINFYSSKKIKGYRNFMKTVVIDDDVREVRRKWWQ